MEAHGGSYIEEIAVPAAHFRSNLEDLQMQLLRFLAPAKVSLRVRHPAAELPHRWARERHSTFR